MERDEYKAAGYRKLHELRLLKLTAAKLIRQADGQTQRGSFSYSSFSGDASAAPPALLRSFSNIEHVMPAHNQRLSRTSSVSTDRSSLPPPCLGRSNSVGSQKLAALLPPPNPHVVVQASGMRAAPLPAAAVGAASIPELMQQGWPRPPRHSEPVGCAGSDERVDLLLSEVESLLAERQQLSARCCSLQRDNDQLAELVGRLTQTMQEQEAHIQQLELQQQHAHAHVDALGPSLALPPALGQAAVPGCSGGSPDRSVQQQQQQGLQKHRQVHEWLGRRYETWQEWQERVPLEHMHSGSSSTLTVALEQQ